ncbi:MAG: hypothetical protein NWE92_04605 [Candidatus Bathyarchaeota archaeon]|nr:hypothetical protein [Candidatus Bathyarchaeota archaeon]
MRKPNFNRKTSTTLTLLLIFAMASTLMILPTAIGNYPPIHYSTYNYVAASPPLVGVGQQVLIVWWLNALPPTAAGAIGDRWIGYIDIIKPDGTNETFGPLTSDSVGGGYMSYVPDAVGKYTCVSRFPGQTLTGVPGNTNSQYVNNTYAASTSKPAYFEVQEDPIPNYQETPLPTDYWTRPIYDANRGWGDAVMGQWLGQPWDTTLSRTVGVQNQAAVLSPHVLWTRPAWTGGVMGGYGDASFYNGIAYETFSSPLVCLDGMGYYAVNNPPRQGWFCINLYNGQTIYFENNTNGQYTIPAMGQILNYESPNQGGGFSYLWRTSGVTVPAGSTSTSTYEMLDGYTGKAILKIANVTQPLLRNGQPVYVYSFFGPSVLSTGATGTQFADTWGGICYLNFANLGTDAAPKYFMQIWNTTYAIWWRPEYGVYPPATLPNGTTNIAMTDTGNDYWMWRPGSAAVGQFGATGYGKVYDGTYGYSMNVSVADINGPRNPVVNQTGSILQIVPDEFVLVGCGGQNDGRGTVQGYIRAYSLAPNTWGQTLWTTTFTPPAASDTFPNSTYNGGVTFGGADSYTNTFWFSEAVTGKQWVYSLTTGQELWTNTIDSAWSYYGAPMQFHNGKAYTTGPGGANSECAFGIITCFNATTGQFLWNFTAPDIGYLESQGSTYTPLEFQFFVDDPITGHTYMYVDGSTGWAGQTVPIRRDSALICIDCDTGEMVWRLEAYPNPEGSCKVVISDSRIIYLDARDDNIYQLGRGPSATTVSAPQLNPILGSSVTLVGTVTDQTDSGRINIAGSVDFTLKGTPAISDEDMAAWMEYMYQQRPMPQNAQGVPVILTAIDPNGNYITIGNTTSDVTGTYGLNWTPEVPGTYQIIATFPGSYAYGSSFAQTYMSVSEPSATPSPAAQITVPANEMYFIGSTIAIIIAVAIAAAAIILVLKKRP